MNPKLLVPKEQWTVFPGDQVKIVSGKDAHMPPAEVLECFHDKNGVRISGIRMNKKRVRPIEGIFEGSEGLQEGFVPLRDLQLVNPATGQPGVATLQWQQDYMGQWRQYRVFEDGGSLPVPSYTQLQNKKYLALKPGKLDTPIAAMAAVTWQPSIGQSPFPQSFWNEAVRLERKNRLPQVL
ncbi:hypothetical protein CXG81DRAFT_12121 [Caulochytrium protostelioides]|uniref:KOW domain-containing protein n=1 Tax=Caulochytrium protostelioides TaxID=1555241 RepID=A0A4P9X7W0_9FUNG|nr:hypothetical protein CXG81DRAFT_12121 [Caulochytrium protostelioides]|eukprot:RKP01346.1 hypothetical protein CXG81DRAFT_12121 [Caulochytrium protostelioides]